MKYFFGIYIHVKSQNSLLGWLKIYIMPSTLSLESGSWGKGIAIMNNCPEAGYCVQAYGDKGVELYYLKLFQILLKRVRFTKHFLFVDNSCYVFKD